MENDGWKNSFLTSFIKKQTYLSFIRKLCLNSKNDRQVKDKIKYFVTTYDDYMLIEDIKKAKNEWLEANAKFQYVCENEIVDYYTYVLKAAQIKYEYYLKKAKERGIKSEIDYKI
jgi:hypothetical protein